MHIKDAQMFKRIITKADTYLSARANPTNVAKYSRYFKEGYDAWGSSEVEHKTLARELQYEYPELSVGQLLELGKLLFQHGKYEMGSLAILLLENRLSEADRDTFDGLQQWFDFGVNNWAHADYLCSRVMPWFLLEEIVSFRDFSSWINSPSRWTRRAAPVTFIKIKKTTDPDQLLAFVEPLMTDPERVVHQGTGWFLRELWKVQPQKVEAFLYHHRNTAARLIIQYATEKLSKEDRLRYRKDKVAKG
jgi:3-methyladenine DNA glycosylase AlkD